MEKNYAERIQIVVAEIFKVPLEQVNLEMKPGDIPGWDSLGHITLLETLQERFELEIPLERALQASTLAELADVIEGAS